jgi:hypothetical protein
MLRTVLILVAGGYTLLGIAALVIGFVLPSDDPLSAVYAIMVGTPWSLVFTNLADRIAENRPVGINIALLVGAIALNVGLLWWWALTRRVNPR